MGFEAGSLTLAKCSFPFLEDRRSAAKGGLAFSVGSGHFNELPRAWAENRLCEPLWAGWLAFQGLEGLVRSWEDMGSGLESGWGWVEEGPVWSKWGLH